jgi:SAM-dependent methyltransferase
VGSPGLSRPFAAPPSPCFWPRREATWFSWQSRLSKPAPLVYDRRMNLQNRYWDTVAYSKKFAHPLLTGELEKRIGLEGRILDYGCGYGRSIRELHERGFCNLYGVDNSSGMIGRARKENPFARYIRNSGAEIPFSDGSFDAVLLLAVLTCMPDSREQARLFSELLRVLKGGGILYVSDLLINSDTRNRERYKRFEPRHGRYGVFELEEGVTLRHHTRKHLERLAASFATISLQEFQVETMNGHRSRAIRMILQKEPRNLPA